MASAERTHDSCREPKGNEVRGPAPGEIEYRTEQRRRRAGIPIEDTTWRRLGEIAARFGISPPRTMRPE
jgi:LDH2 family malate/lactate/ureidoglycolate dehydrogenase